MKKPIIKELQKGRAAVYEFSAVTAHIYQTEDPMDDTVILLEKAGHGVVIDPPSFFDNIKSLDGYIKSLGITIDGVVLDYHMAGASFLPDVKKYSTKDAAEYGQHGIGKSMVNNFAKSFGKAFDSSLPEVTDFIESDRVTIAGIELVISETHDGFDIEIPEINSVYIHMLGHDTHSIIANVGQAHIMIKQLSDFIEKGYELVLSSHYGPENLDDVKTKIAYLEELIKVAETVQTADEFKQAMQEAFPSYGGDHYLDMTAGFLFS